MKKLLRLKTMLLLCALIAGSGSVWATETTISVGKSSMTWTEDGTDQKATSGDFSFRYEKGSYNNAISGGLQDNELRLYSGTNFIISSDYTITKIVYNVADGSGKNYSVSALSTADGNLINGTWTGSAKSITATLSAQNRIKSVTITYNNAPAYTITPTVNEDLMGTASVDGSTITATPNDGYRVIAGDDGYTVTDGTATVAHEGYSNTLTVTPSTDCTVQVNFEAIPSHTLSYAVSPAGAGSVTLGATSVREDTSTTIEAIANAGYKFTGWSITGTGATIDDDAAASTSMTMGTADATVTANFDAVTTYAINWSVNGNVVRTDNVEENTAITFPTSISGIPAGYELKGWSTATVLTPQNTLPATKVNAATSTANVTYYAILAVKTASGPDTYEKLESDEFETGATYVIGAAQSSSNTTMWYFNNYNNTVDANASWGKMTTDPATNAPITFTLSGTASALVAQDNRGNYLKGLSTGNFQMSSTSTTIGLSDDGSINNQATYKLRHNYNNGNGGLRWYSSTTGAQAYFFKVVSGDVYDNFCTTVPDIDVTVSAAEYATFSDYAARDFSESGITVYIAKAKGTSVALTEVTDGIVPANTGVVLYKAGGTAAAQSIPAVATEKTTLEDNEMMANVERTSIKQTAANGNTNYILANESSVVGFYLAATDGAYLNAHRAYLSTSTVAGAREFLGFDMDDTTGIMDTNHETMTNNGEYFNLAGQRVAQPAKGLYIVNGKKIVIR